jgi:hypothetical protein
MSRCPTTVNAKAAHLVSNTRNTEGRSLKLERTNDIPCHCMPSIASRFTSAILADVPAFMLLDILYPCKSDQRGLGRLLRVITTSG